MLILIKNFGQTSNIFFQHISYDAFCREHNIPFHNQQLQPYFKEYPHLNEQGKSKFSYWLTGIWIKASMKLGSKKVAVFDSWIKDKEYEAFVLQQKDKKSLCEGWCFRDWALMRKYRHVYQQLFRLPQERMDGVKKHLEKPTEDHFLVAVHIRRGDYKEFEGGRYYFDDATYMEKMQQMAVALKGACKFLIFTNDDALNKDVYRDNFEHLYFSGNSVAEDHYLMSQCDYIIGASSTFSSWASYIGEKPVLHIDDASDVMQLERFYVYPNPEWEVRNPLHG